MRVSRAHEHEHARAPWPRLDGTRCPEDRERALEVGFLDHLPKPVDAAALVAAVKMASRTHPGRTRPS